MIRLGVVGYGYWGPNLVRNFSETDGCEVAAVCDRLPERLALVRRRYPSMRAAAEYREIIDDPSIHAVAIATPVHAHHEIALAALRSGKHVFVEKPIAATSAQAGELIAEAARRGLRLMVDYTFLYTGAVRKIRELIESGELGSIYYYDSTRINLGLFQQDVNIIWDLAVHDLSIMDYVIPARPVAVSAVGLSHFRGQPENIAFLTLFFDEPIIAHINVNWLAPVKVRRTLIGGSAKMIVYDDVEPSEKVKVYDRGIVVTDTAESIYKMLVSYRSGDVFAPNLDMTEALKLESREFIDCIVEGRNPHNDGQAGLRILRILEAATESIRQQGRMVTL